MINFKSYLSEQSFRQTFNSFDDIIPLIKRDCSQFLNDAKNYPLYRGIDTRTMSSLGNFFFSPTPTNRRSVDSGADLNFVLNTSIQYNFGIIDARSNSFFTTGSDKVARGYGDVLYVFPTDNYISVWSPQIGDPVNNESIIMRDVADLFREKYKGPTIGTNIFVNLLYRLGDYIGAKAWVDNTSTNTISKSFLELLEESTLESLVTPEYNLERIVLILSECLKEYANYAYSKGDIQEAIKSKNEILITGCDGYYAINTNQVPSSDEYGFILNLLK